MGKLSELLERVEKATGPDRRLDSDVHAACGMYINPRERAWEYGRWSREGIYDVIPPITARIDAALALVERKLPGVFWFMSRGRVTSMEKLFACSLLFGTDEVLGQGEANTAPLAILAALLRALSEQEGRNG